MRNKIKLLLATLILMFGLTGLLAIPSGSASAQANIKGNTCSGVEFNVTGGGGCVGGSEGTLNKLVANIVNVLSIIVGIVAVIMIIIGGFKYITSGGDSGNISSAKTTIVYALVGLVIVALAQVIVRFVLSKAT